jgi:O-antigen ligase
VVKGLRILDGIRGARLNLPLEHAAAAALGACVVLFTLGSSSVPRLKTFGHDARWLALFALWAVALLLVARRRSVEPAGLAAAVALFGALLVGVMFVSAAWSGNPRLTVERAASFAVLASAAGALAVSAADRRRIVGRLVAGILAGAALVLAAGFVLLLVHRQYAEQAASVSSGWRFRGLGENPNTVSMLAAIVLPLAVWTTTTARDARWTAFAGATTILAYLTVVLSGSRGALLGAFLGMLVFLLGLRPLRFAARVGAFAGVAFVVAVAVSRIPQPLVSEVAAPVASPAVTTQPETTVVTTPRTTVATTPTTTVVTTPNGGTSTSSSQQTVTTTTLETVTTTRIVTVTTPTTTSPAPPKPQPLPSHPGTQVLGRLEDEVGLGESSRRTFFGTSGRAQAWGGAIDQGNERPLLGYGFGTEDDVFFDRFQVFQGERPENSFIGLYLQLGLVGLALFVALGVALLWAGVQAFVRVQNAEQRLMLGGLLGVVAAGIGLMLFQSYAYAAGNIAAATFWTCAFLVVAIAGRREGT